MIYFLHGAFDNLAIGRKKMTLIFRWYTEFFSDMRWSLKSLPLKKKKRKQSLSAYDDTGESEGITDYFHEF